VNTLKRIPTHLVAVTGPSISTTRFPILTVGAVLLAVALLAPAIAAEQGRLTRDEVAVVKKKLVAVFDAVGQAPAGYIVEDENFQLPTEFYSDRSPGKFRLINSSAQRRLGGGAEQVKQQSQEELTKDYEKKIAEAMAKGDLMAIQQISQDMQKKMGEAQLKQIEARKPPIELSIQLNTGVQETIDPDRVLFEGPGVIALKHKTNKQEQGEVSVYFDPVSLKDTKQLSVVEFKEPQGGVGGKVVVLNIVVRLSGPGAEVEGWAKRIGKEKVLAQVDAAR
jgi:hypothetical protein